MCICRPCYSCSHIFRVRPRRIKVRVRGLSMTSRSDRAGVKQVLGTEMELKNLKLYLENRSIIAENEKLRKKALLLHEENQALMFEFQKKFSHLQDFPGSGPLVGRCKYPSN